MVTYSEIRFLALIVAIPHFAEDRARRALGIRREDIRAAVGGREATKQMGATVPAGAEGVEMVELSCQGNRLDVVFLALVEDKNNYLELRRVSYQTYFCNPCILTLFALTIVFILERFSVRSQYGFRMFVFIINISDITM